MVGNSRIQRNGGEEAKCYFKRLAYVDEVEVNLNGSERG